MFDSGEGLAAAETDDEYAGAHRCCPRPYWVNAYSNLFVGAGRSWSLGPDAGDSPLDAKTGFPPGNSGIDTGKMCGRVDRDF